MIIIKITYTRVYIYINSTSTNDQNGQGLVGRQWSSLISATILTRSLSIYINILSLKSVRVQVYYATAGPKNKPFLEGGRDDVVVAYADNSQK